jgi:hypothetical protein
VKPFSVQLVCCEPVCVSVGVPVQLEVHLLLTQSAGGGQKQQHQQPQGLLGASSEVMEKQTAPSSTTTTTPKSNSSSSLARLNGNGVLAGFQQGPASSAAVETNKPVSHLPSVRVVMTHQGRVLLDEGLGELQENIR